jgi:hypothetical protein
VSRETKDEYAELSSFSRDARSHKSDEMMLLKPNLSRSGRSSSSQPSHDLLLPQVSDLYKSFTLIFSSRILCSLLLLERRFTDGAMDHDSVYSRKSTLIRAVSGDKRHFLSA